MVTWTARPLSSWLLTTSESSACCFRMATSFGVKLASATASAAFQREVVLGAADGVVESQILHRLHVQGDAGMLEVSSRNRRMICVAVIVRESRGFRLMRNRPLFKRDVVTVDTDERRQAGDIRIFENRLGERLLAFAMAAYETPSVASDTPWMRPVSWSGKKPLELPRRVPR